jgi:hypothetical protein
MSLLIAAAAMLAGPNCVDALCNADALAPYFRKLAEARRSTSSRSGTATRRGMRLPAGGAICSRRGTAAVGAACWRLAGLTPVT